MHDTALVNEHHSELAAAIGVRVRHERQARAWTLDQLANMSRVSRRTLIDVEQGAANPSVGTLLRIADALGIGLPALVEPPRPNALAVTRHGDGATLWTGARGGSGVLVAGTDGPDVVELWDWTLAPGDRHESEPHSPGTRELLQVIAGAITVTLGDRSIELRTGDAASFAADEPHAYINLTACTARFSLAVYEPGLESGTRTEFTRG